MSQQQLDVVLVVQSGHSGIVEKRIRIRRGRRTGDDWSAMSGLFLVAISATAILYSGVLTIAAASTIAF